MTTIKPPVVFKPSDFKDTDRELLIDCRIAAADRANEILTQRLKPYYGCMKIDGEASDTFFNQYKDESDDHVVWGFDPIEIPKPPVKKEITREELAKAWGEFTKAWNERVKPHSRLNSSASSPAFERLCKELGL